MPRFGLAHPRLPAHLQCPGCHTLLTSENAISHVAGCSTCTGNNATTKHNKMVHRLYELCIKAGIPCEREPRQFSTYTCGKCGAHLDGDSKPSHQRICGSGSFHHSGPDLVIHWADGDVFYDFTIVHELCPSNLTRGGTILMRDAIKRKNKTYVASKLLPQIQFQCIPMLAGGAMHANTKNLLLALADACGLERDYVIQDFTLRLQEFNGSVVLSQLGKFLVPQSREDTAI